MRRLGGRGPVAAKFLNFTLIHVLSTVEIVTCPVIKVILEPEPVKIPVSFIGGEKGQWFGQAEEYGAKKLGGVAETLPVASGADSIFFDGRNPLAVVTKIIHAAIATGVSVAVAAVDIEVIHAPAAGERGNGFVLIVLAQGVQGTQRREDAQAVSVFWDGLEQGLEKPAFLQGAEAYNVIGGASRVNRLQIRLILYGHGVAEVDDGKAHVLDKMEEVP